MTSLATLMPVLMAALGLAGYYLRAASPRGGFWHTYYGHALITLGSGLVGAGASWLQSGQLTQAAAVNALVAALAAWLGALKPLGTDGGAK